MISFAAQNSKLHSLSDEMAACEIRRLLLACHTFLVQESWWLVGTESCHLCEVALELVRLAGTGYVLPSVQKVEVLDLCEPYLSKLAPQIPLLITPRRVLIYPFGLMDVVACLQANE